MSITLSDINEKLITQNQLQEAQSDILQNINVGISGVASNMSKFTERFKSDELRAKEREREQQQDKSLDRSADRTTENKIATPIKSLSDFLPAGGLFGIGQSLVAALPGFLLKRALPAFLAKAFADEIADYIESATGSKDLGDAIYRGLNLGALGFLISKKLGLVGFFAGALLDDDNKKKLESLGGELKTLGDNISDLIGVEIPSFQEALSFVTNTFGGAIDAVAGAVTSLNALMGDDTEENAKKLKEGSDQLAENATDLATTIGLLALMLSPRGTIGLAFAGISAAFAGIRAAAAKLKPGGITNVNQKLPGVIVPDKEGNVTSKDGKKFKATSPQGQMIIQASKDRAARAMGAAAGMDPSKAVDVVKKYPRFGKLLGVLNGIPGANLAINAGMLAMILMDDKASADDKITAGGGFFTGLAGSTMGAALGTAIFPGLGTVAGGVGGFFLGDALGKYVMEWVLGKRDNIGAGIQKAIKTDSGITTGEFGHIDETSYSPTSSTGQTRGITPTTSQTAVTLAEANTVSRSTVGDGSFRFFNQQDNSVSVSNPTEVYSGPTGTATDAIANRLLPYSPSF
jgi:hypothetical protein